jgi:hypothetical protein
VIYGNLLVRLGELPKTRLHDQFTVTGFHRARLQEAPLAVDDTYTEGRLGPFGRVLNKGLGGPGRVVTAPEPSHLLGELCPSFCRCMGALASPSVPAVEAFRKQVAESEKQLAAHP